MATYRNGTYKYPKRNYISKANRCVGCEDFPVELDENGHSLIYKQIMEKRKQKEEEKT